MERSATSQGVVQDLAFHSCDNLTASPTAPQAVVTPHPPLPDQTLTVAVGVGFGLALAADIRITGRTTSFHVGAVKIGLSAGECGISYHLPRLIGASRAAELMLTGRPVDAAEAERIGLTGSVVEDNELVANALAMGSKVLQNSPYSTRHTKQLFWSNLEAPSLEAALQRENRTQIMALLTQDFQEAVAAFSEKRAPVFTGR